MNKYALAWRNLKKQRKTIEEYAKSIRQPEMVYSMEFCNYPPRIRIECGVIAQDQRRNSLKSVNNKPIYEKLRDNEAIACGEFAAKIAERIEGKTKCWRMRKECSGGLMVYYIKMVVD